MESSKEIKKEKKLDTLLCSPQMKNLFVIE